MKQFQNLTTPQKFILILIAGMVSIIGLFEISDYYSNLSSPLFTVFFSTILLLTIFSPVFYLAGKRNPERNPKERINWHRVSLIILTVITIVIAIYLLETLTKFP